MTKRYYIGSVCGDAPLLDMQGDCLISDVNDRNALKKEFPCVLERLNEQDQRIQELESQLEFWKGSAGVCQGELGIVNHELGIALEQGYKLSDAYMEYKEDKEKECSTDD